MNKIKNYFKNIIPKTVKGKIILSAIILALFGAGMWLITIYNNGDIYTLFTDPEDLDDATWHKWNKKKTEHASYVGETTYDGSSDVPYIVYDIPFRSEGEEEGGDMEQAYGSNKDIMAAFSEKRVDAYMDAAHNYVDLVLGQSYKSIGMDADAYMAKVLDYYSDPQYFADDDTLLDEDNDEGAMDLTLFVNRLTEFYVDNKITCTYEWVTDDSLLYRTQFSYTVRGIVKLTITSPDHEAGEECTAFKEVFGVDAKYGEEIELLVNVGFGAWNDTDSLSIGIFEMGDIEAIKDIIY